MLISERYYLQEKPEKEMTYLWQIIQLILYISSIIVGALGSYSLNKTVYLMQGNCILYTDLLISHNHSGHQHLVNIYETRWTSVSSCYYSIYVPISVAIFSCVFIVMFVMCGRGGQGSGLPKPWSIVIPSVIYNFVCFVLITMSSFNAFSGIQVFCDFITMDIEDADKFEKWCEAVSVLFVENDEVGAQLYTHINWCKAMWWLMIATEAFGVIWSLLRCLCGADFYLVHTMSYSYGSHNRRYSAKVTSIESSTSTAAHSNSSE